LNIRSIVNKVYGVKETEDDERNGMLKGENGVLGKFNVHAGHPDIDTECRPLQPKSHGRQEYL
jgi:hypothetical protein